MRFHSVRACHWLSLILVTSLFTGGQAMGSTPPETSPTISSQNAELLKMICQGDIDIMGNVVDLGQDGRLELVCLVEEKYAGEERGDERQLKKLRNSKKETAKLVVSGLGAAERKLVVCLGEGTPAGLLIQDVDKDGKEEFIVAAGSFAKSIVEQVLSALFLSTFYNTNVFHFINPTVEVSRVYCIDDDGSIIWMNDYKDGEQSRTHNDLKFLCSVSSPDGKDPVLVVTYSDDRMVCGLSAVDGSVRWQRHCRPGTAREKNYHRIIDCGDRAFVLSDDGDGSSCCDALNGEQMFASDLNLWPIYFPTGLSRSGKHVMVMTTLAGRARLMSLETGTVLKQFKSPARGLLIGGYIVNTDKSDEKEIVFVWGQKLETFTADGHLLKTKKKPWKTVKAAMMMDPDGDGQCELLVLTRKNGLLYDFESDGILWQINIENDAKAMGLRYDFNGDGVRDFLLTNGDDIDLKSGADGSRIDAIGH